MFRKGFVDFCAVAAVAKKARGMRILQVGSRPAAVPFRHLQRGRAAAQVRHRDHALLLRGARHDVKKILETRADEVDEGVRLYAEKVDVSKMPVESQRAQQALKLAILDKVVSSKSDGRGPGVLDRARPGHRRGRLPGDRHAGDLGIPCACETDVLGAISAVLLKAATLGREPIFFADITVRHANDDNTELLWHCGPFPVSLAHPNAKPAIAPWRPGPVRAAQRRGDHLPHGRAGGQVHPHERPGHGGGRAGKGRHLRLGQGQRLGEVGGEARLRPLHPPRGPARLAPTARSSARPASTLARWSPIPWTRSAASWGK